MSILTVLVTEPESLVTVTLMLFGQCVAVTYVGIMHVGQLASVQRSTSALTTNITLWIGVENDYCMRAVYRLIVAILSYTMQVFFT